MLTPVLISVIVTLIVVGLLLYLIGLIPMDGTIKQIIRAVVIIAVVIWLLQGVWTAWRTRAAPADHRSCTSLTPTGPVRRTSTNLP